MWTCASCGERLEPSFDECWRCATQRELTPAENAEAAAQEHLEEQILAEMTAASVETASLPASLQEELDIQAHWITPQHQQAARAGLGLTRLRKAYSYYRARQHQGTHAQLANLDRVWGLFFLLMGMFGGLVLLLFLSPDALFRLLPGDIGIFAIIGSMFLSILVGQYVTGRELREAEQAQGASTRRAT